MILQGFQLSQITENITWIHQVLVDVVEVVQQHLAPVIKLVKWLIALPFLFKNLMQHKNQGKLIGFLQSGKMLHQITDGKNLRRPYRVFELTCQIALKKQSSAYVWKNQTNIG